MPELASAVFHTATVISVNPKTLTCDLMRTAGGMLYSVPIANTTGGIFSNDVSWNSNLRGAVVYYAYIAQNPFILGTLPIPTQPSSSYSTGSTSTGTGGDNPKTYGSASGQSYSSGRSTGHQPSDKVIASDGGASISLLGEGGVVLQASPLCQMILGAGMDFMRVVAREFSIFTDFGSLDFSHGSSGRTGLTIKGGAAYGEEAQAGSGTHTVFMQLGDTEDAPETRFGVRVTSTDGGDFGALSMGKDGQLIFTTSKDYLLMVGHEKHTVVDGDTYDDLRGNHAEKVAKERRLEVGLEENHTVGTQRNLTIGSDETHTVAGRLDLQVGGTLEIGCSGLVFKSASSSGGMTCDIACSSFNLTRA